MDKANVVPAGDKQILKNLHLISLFPIAGKYLKEHYYIFEFFTEDTLQNIRI